MLGLFDPTTVESLIASFEVSFRGIRDFGPVRSNRLIIKAGDPTPNDGMSLSWDLYIAQGEQPVPIYLRPDRDSLFPTLAGLDRYSGSDVRLTEWSFVPADPDSFRVEIEANEELVDSQLTLGVGEQTALNPMVGRTLPAFTATNDAGETVRSQELFRDGPLVLVLWGSENAAIGPWWETIDGVGQKYQDRGVRLETLHLGPDRLLADGLKRWEANPPILKNCSDPTVFSPGSSAIDWYGVRKPVEPG
ncbi:MAG: hypothetical protein AAF907_18105, partial [Planctomycetota bacterium]